MNTEISVPVGASTSIYKYQDTVRHIARRFVEKIKEASLGQVNLPRGYRTEYYIHSMTASSRPSQYLGLFRDCTPACSDTDLRETYNVALMRAFCDDLKTGLADEITSELVSQINAVRGQMAFLNTFSI